jgi:hypothetical protein
MGKQSKIGTVNTSEKGTGDIMEIGILLMHMAVLRVFVNIVWQVPTVLGSVIGVGW